MRNWLFPICAAALILVDQATKGLARAWLSEPLYLFDKVGLALVKNTGGLFGLFSDSNVLLVWLSVTVLGLLSWAGTVAKERSQRVLIAIAGAVIVSNLIDRVALGYVTDMIQLGSWPVFNLADAALTLAVLGLAWTALQKR